MENKWKNQLDHGLVCNEVWQNVWGLLEIKGRIKSRNSMQVQIKVFF